MQKWFSALALAVSAAALALSVWACQQADARSIVPPPDPFAEPLRWFCYHGWMVVFTTTAIAIIIAAWFWHIHRISRKRAAVLDGPDADFRELD
jgi:hypothetical protein